MIFKIILIDFVRNTGDDYWFPSSVLVIFNNPAVHVVFISSSSLFTFFLWVINLLFSLFWFVVNSFLRAIFSCFSLARSSLKVPNFSSKDSSCSRKWKNKPRILRLLSSSCSRESLVSPFVESKKLLMFSLFRDESQYPLWFYSLLSMS